MSFKTQKSFSPVQNTSKLHSSATASAPAESELSSPWHRFAWILKDGVVLSCIGLAFFLFLVLFSYDPSDPGFDSSGGGQTIQNYGGATGAWLASMMLYLFGFFGFLVPVGILMAGWVTLKIRSGNELDYLRFVLSLLGLLMMITAGAGLANLYLNPDLDGIQLPYSAGGVWGYELSRWLVSEMDLLGTTLFYLVTFALAMSMLSSCSWLAILEGTGRVACWLTDKLVGHFKLREVYLQRIKALLERVKVRYGHWHDQAIARRNQQYRMDNPMVDFATDAKEIERLLSPKMTVPEVLLSTVKGWVFNPRRKKASIQPTAPRTLATHSSASSAVPEAKLAESAPSSASTTRPPKSVDSLADELAESAPSIQDEPHTKFPAKPPTQAVVGKKAVVTHALAVNGAGQLPSLELLSPIPSYDEGFSQADLTALSELLEQRLLEFGVSVKVESVQPGPVVTRFEILPAPGVKVSQINNLAKDLARVLSVPSVRVVDVIPGKAVVGIEIPNEQREIVSFRDVLSSSEFQNATSPLTIALGKDIAGKPVVADIGKMPHLLVAGTTGAGKSVGVNSMILSLLYKSTPDEVRLIMVDPKMLELSIYEGIPHLLTPVVTDMSDAANALRWCVFEMDRRYMLMAKLGVRNIAGYNLKVKDAIDRGEPIIDPMYQQAANFGHSVGEIPPTLETLPYIVVVVDEFADMIMVVGKEVEQLIARIAQKARAAGIHLVLATQRPSVNVITGLIKANIPTRISFMVNTKIDSRTILDQGGAEQLLGMGDMLFMPPGSGNPRRVHGAFMSDEEVHKVANFVKSQGAPQYLESITKGIGGADSPGTDYEDAESDALYDEAVEFVTHGRRVSISSVQRRFKIGYNRAARIVEAMEAAGVVSTAGSNGNREVLAPKSHDH